MEFISGLKGLSDASYSDTHDNKSSSFDEVNVSALNERQIQI
jgi:hypothetical protein